jgi:small-conductance mechanosensitive channel
MAELVPGFPVNLIIFASLTLLALLVASFEQGERAGIRNTLVLMTVLFLLTVVLSLQGGNQQIEALTWANALVHFLFGLLGIRILGQFLFRLLFPRLRISWPTFVGDLAVVLAWLGWGMLWLREIGLDVTEIVATSAVLTAIAAFAMQDTLGNVIDGIALQSDQSIKLGDWIRLDDIEGRVVDIRWRSIKVETRNWETVVIPNGLLMNSKFKILGERRDEPLQWRRWIWFQIDYAHDPALVMKSVEEAVGRAKIENVSSRPAPNCLMMGYEESVARYALRYWLTDFAKDDPTDSEVRYHIYLALGRAGLSPAIPSQNLFVVESSDERKALQLAKEIEDRVAALQAVDLFDGVEESEIQQLALTLREETYAKGDLIAEQGTVDDSLFLIVGGTVEVRLPGEERINHDRLTLGTGDFFGERGLLMGTPRAASAVAAETVLCLRLERGPILKFLKRNPTLTEEISKVMATRHDVLDRSVAEIRQAHDSNDHHSEILSKVQRFLGL